MKGGRILDEVGPQMDSSASRESNPHPPPPPPVPVPVTASTASNTPGSRSHNNNNNNLHRHRQYQYQYPISSNGRPASAAPPPPVPAASAASAAPAPGTTSASTTLGGVGGHIGHQGGHHTHLAHHGVANHMPPHQYTPAGSFGLRGHPPSPTAVSTSTSSAPPGPAIAAAPIGVPSAPSPASSGRSNTPNANTTSTGNTNNTNNANNANNDDGATDGAPAKKRKTGPGSRGVANLTPDQLAKKRANDREAQRAIRERTKSQMESLQQQIRDLTSQQPYLELQTALEEKQAVEQELANNKMKLESIVSMIQPMIGNAIAEGSCASPQPHNALQSTTTTSAVLSHPVGHIDARPPPASGPTPSSAASSWPSQPHAKTQDGEYPHQQESGPHPAQNILTALQPGQISQGIDEYTNPGLASFHTLSQQSKMITQQRLETMRGLSIGPDRLELDFLLEPRHGHAPTAHGHPAIRKQIPRLQMAVDGAQDSPEFHHVPMKHDGKPSDDTGVGAPPSAGQYSTPSPMSLVAQTPPQNPLPSGAPGVGAPSSPYVAASSASGSVSGTTSTGIPSNGQADNASQYDPAVASVENCAPTCPLDTLLLGFLAERRQRAEEGLDMGEVAGPRYPSVLSLLNPAQSAHSHPLSKVFTDILATFPDISALPERVAVLYIMFLIMRWQISPTRENYSRLPPWVRPSGLQLSKVHPAWIDHVPFPEMRERLVRDYDPDVYPFDNFFVPFTTTLSLNWPYGDTKVLLQSPDGSNLMINPVFEEHLMRSESWTLGTAFRHAFPTLDGSFGVRDKKVKVKEWERDGGEHLGGWTTGGANSYNGQGGHDNGEGHGYEQCGHGHGHGHGCKREDSNGDGHGR